MKIKKVAFGNSIEAFIENRFGDNVNIIYSNDNNRGKTLLMQSLMYSIGYDSIFPSSFDSNLYFFFSEIEIENQTFHFLRKKNSIIIKSKNLFHICNTISEFKYYFDKEILKLPRIIKDGKEKIVDPSLLYELFFLGQDKRNTSTLISKGQYNKSDFKNMLFSLKGYLIVENNDFKDTDWKINKQIIEDKIKSLKKKLVKFKSSSIIAEYSEKSFDVVSFEKIKIIISNININILELKKQRNREQNRIGKLQNLQQELNSLNRDIEIGKIKCSDCGSENFTYSNKDFEFEISNSVVRHNIIKSISEDITLKEEIVEELTISINSEQTLLAKELEVISPDVKDYILFHDEILNSKSIDDEIYTLMEELKIIGRTQKLGKLKEIQNKKGQDEFIKSILSEMISVYHRIDKLGTLYFDDIFTTNDKTFSGSEEQEFYFSKLIALNNILEHQYPIIIDSFRDGEISSLKELMMLSIFKELNKQVVITATLKDEEYSSNKYVSDLETNVLDYSDYQDSKILQNKYAESFVDILKEFDCYKLPL
jgi:hypothetical protein